MHKHSGSDGGGILHSISNTLARIERGVKELERQQEDLFVLLGGRQSRHEAETDARFRSDESKHKRNS